MTIAETLASIRVLVEEQKCPACGATGEIMRLEDFPEPVLCPTCNSTGLDPTYAALLNVVRVECPTRSGHAAEGIHCSVTGGWMARSWDGLPPGALVGALEEAALEAQIPLEYHYFPLAHKHLYHAGDYCADGEPITGESFESRNEAAADAVLAALKEANRE